MCNLNIFVKKSGTDVLFRLQNVTAVSYAGNSHGEGVYLDYRNYHKKGRDKLDYAPMAKLIKKSSFVITHQRLATSGFTAEFSHPFVSERFVLVHNGIFPVGDAKKSDTAVFFDKFLKFFAEKGDILQAINKSLEKVGYGSYSVFIYDKVLHKGYYFKGYACNIEIVKCTDGSLFITTEKDNLIYVDVKKKRNVDNYALYEFFIKDGKPVMQKVGKIEEHRTTVTYSYGDFGTARYYGFDKVDDSKPKETVTLGVQDSKQQQLPLIEKSGEDLQNQGEIAEKSETKQDFAKDAQDVQDALREMFLGTAGGRPVYRPSKKYEDDRDEWLEES